MQKVNVILRVAKKIGEEMEEVETTVVLII